VIAALAFIVAVLAVVLVVLILDGIRGLRRDVDRLHGEVAQLQRNAATAHDVRTAVANGIADATRPVVEDDTPAISRVPDKLRTGPVIKAMALGSGTAHAARRLRGTANGRNGH
jgi:hypothetical protein